MYIIYYSVNNIGSAGIKLLIKAELPLLQTLALGIIYDMLELCGLGDEGARHLVKGHWPKLAEFRIGNLLLIQDGTRSSMMDMLASPPATGRE